MATETAHIEDFLLPSLGSDMDEGTVLVWLVDVGDQVTKGDTLVRVDTEKAEIDVEVWHDATVAELLVKPGETIPVGTPIARLETNSRAGSAPAPAKPPTVEEQPPVDEPQTSAPVTEPPVTPTRTRSPQPATMSSSQLQDVAVTPRLVYWPRPSGEPEAPALVQPEPVKQSRAERRQGAVAALMERSNREIPHFHLVRQVDLTAALGWLDTHNEQVPPTERVLPAAVMLYAVAKAAGGTVINGTFVDQPVDAGHVDLGVAVHVRGGGLMTPVIPAAEELAVDALMAELQAIVGRARSNRLSSSDLTPATLTVTNLGDAGADRVLGVIRPPERALVGIGRIAERPVVVDGAVAVRRTVDVSLSADHRVINGHAGAQFLDRLDDVLSKPDDFTLGGTP